MGEFKNLRMNIRNFASHLLFAFVFFLLVLPVAVQAQPDTWAISFGSTYQDYPEDLIVDASGNVYVCGYFRDTLHIGSIELAAKGNADVFLAKFDPTGQAIWAKCYGGFENEFAHGLAFDKLGNVIMVGEYQDSTIFETDSVWSQDTLWYGPYSHTYDVFWVRITPAGNMEKFWADGWYGSENFYEVNVGEDSLYYFGGMYRTFCYFALNGPLAGGWGKGYDDAIWVRSDSSGFMDHRAIAQGRYVDRAQAIDLIGDSLVVMGGTFQDTCYFKDSSVYKITAFEDDIFVSCYNDTSLFRWAIQGGSKAIDELNALVTDALGNTYIGGTFDSLFNLDGTTLGGYGRLDGYVAKINLQGDVVWLKGIGGAGFDIVRDLRIDANGELLVTGYFQRSVDLGNGVTLSMTGDTLDQNAFVAKYDLAGNAIWAKNLGGSSPEVGVAVNADLTNHVFALGTFTGSGQFGQATLNSLGSEDIYLLRMNADGAVGTPNPVARPLGFVRAWPNPAKDAFQLEFDLARSGNVSVELLDLNGRTVQARSLGHLPMGTQGCTIQANDVPSGLYLYRLTGVDGSYTGKIVLGQ
jgi:hypothetical protein